MQIKLKPSFSFFSFIIAAFILSSCSGPSVDDEERAELKMNLGIGFLQSQKYPEAIAALKDAIDLNPESPEAHNNLGLAYYGSENWASAEEHFLKATELRPQFPEALSNLCSTYNQMGRYDDAISTCKRALAIETYSSPEFAMTNLGISYTQKNDLKSAQDWLEKAVARSPSFCQSHTAFGKMHMKAKSYPDAVRSFESAIRHCPMFQEAHYRLGLSLSYMGQRKRALRVLEEFLHKFPDSHYSKPARKVIAELSASRSG